MIREPVSSFDEDESDEEDVADEEEEQYEEQRSWPLPVAPVS